ncbi:hypothetical protein ACFL0S_03200 [Thermodesulfobacteriota bacterium]
MLCAVYASFIISSRKLEYESFLFGQLSIFQVAILLAILIILIATLAVALVYPPNNYDSMTYHLPRVAHWISNKDISFYPTNNPRQNFQMPLSEFAIMHLQVLTASDLFANVIQWINFVILIFLGQLIAAELGLNERQQIITSFLIATLPMVILQASSTQNDLVASSFVVSFSLYMLRIQKSIRLSNYLFAAMALGLALLTKGTAYVYCATMGIALAIPVLLKCKFEIPCLLKRSIGYVFVIVVAFSLNAGHLSRNYKLYGHPLSTETQLYQNAERSFPALTANLSRNVGIHLGMPYGPINDYSNQLMKLALGAQLNNPKTTWPGTEFKIQFRRHEDIAGNFAHTIVVLIIMLALPLLWLYGYFRQTIWYAIGVFSGFIFFCWLLKWQPWASRLHTPLFIMACPLLAIPITLRNNGIGKRISQLVVLLFFLGSLIFIFKNETTPLLSHKWSFFERDTLYFIARPKALHQDYKIAIDIITESENREVGLITGRDDLEYPLWALLSQNKGREKKVIFRHIVVNDISKKLEKKQKLPDYIIATRSVENWKYKSSYFPIYNSTYISVLKKIEN